MLFCGVLYTFTTHADIHNLVPLSLACFILDHCSTAKASCQQDVSPCCDQICSQINLASTQVQRSALQCREVQQPYPGCPNHLLMASWLQRLSCGHLIQSFCTELATNYRSMLLSTFHVHVEQERLEPASCLCLNSNPARECQRQ